MALIDTLKGRRFGVVLSSGYFGFYGHAGFTAALAETELSPDAWAGTSAGGMIAAFAASQFPIPTLKQRLLSRTKADFWDPSPLASAWATLRGGVEASGLLKGEKFVSLLRSDLPFATFERLPKPLLIVATDLTRQAPAVLQHGDLPSAVHATCAYPGLFQAVPRDGTLLWDGGLVDKAPVAALAEAHPELEVLLIHLLPSTDRFSAPSGALAYVQGMSAGIAALRTEHLALQLKWLSAMGKEVHVFTNELPRVTPDTMAQGASAYEAARANTLAWLRR
jgi:NTE family protein